MKKQIFYKISNNVKIKEGNKIFLNDFHLFTCNKDALIVIQSIPKNSFASLYDIKENITTKKNIIDIDDLDSFIFQILEYLLRCNVLEHIHSDE